MGAGTSTNLTADQHLQCAKALFNFTWSLLDKSDRSADERELMIHASHASAYHWRQVGQPKNFIRSDWQLARVYAVCRRAEPAMHHAQQCLALCQAHGVAGFDLAYAHEAMARAAMLAGDDETALSHLTNAERAAGTVDDLEDRALLTADLAELRAALSD